MAFIDFNVLLHALRTNELKKMPPGAKVILSAGCAGRAYFDWLRDSYPGISRHLGIEAYLPRPADLPDEAVWLPDYLSDMKSVADQEVDLVFAGQTIEHLWPDQITGFFCEAHRVLKPDSWFVLDSPNRRFTREYDWYHPEHTTEFTIDEARELVHLAGFQDIRIKGVWLCYDRDKKSYLPLIPDLSNINIDSDFRVVEAYNRPEDSFVWWIEARKDASHVPDRKCLAAYSQAIYDRVFPQSLQRVYTEVGEIQQLDQNRIIVGAANKQGYLRFGPYAPFRPGKYTVQLNIGYLGNEELDPEWFNLPALKLDVSVNMGAKTVAKKNILISELIREPVPFNPDKRTGLTDRIKKLFYSPGKHPPQPEVFPYHFKKQEITFSLSKVEFGVEFRVFTMGRIPLVLDASVVLIECRDQAK